MTIDEIFADDRRNPPVEHSLPWEETCGDVTVVIEPKSHWAVGMRAFRLTDRAYCYYADWTAHGPMARFFDHPDTRGDDLMMKARAMLAREIADGLRSE